MLNSPIGSSTTIAPYSGIEKRDKAPVCLLKGITNILYYIYIYIYIYILRFRLHNDNLHI